MRPANSIQIHARHHVGLILALFGLMCVVTLMPGSAGLASAQVVGPSWSYTGSLNTARTVSSATLLPNGKVLVAAGYGLAGPPFNSAELYDPASGTWNSTGSLNTKRFGHTATLLPNGKVLVVGGSNFGSNYVSGILSAELFDPASGTWSSTGNLNTGRFEHTATLLPNGKVLVAGGVHCDPNGVNCITLDAAELYDPAAGTWSGTGNLNIARHDHTATLLPNGNVLVAGGSSFVSGDLSSAELYDPATGTWNYTGNLKTGRAYHTAALLPNGKVLVAGVLVDCNEEGVCFSGNSTELYDPAAGTWSITGNLNYARSFHTATLLPNGKVLVAGGDDGFAVLNSAELYDPATGTWSITAYLNTPRINHMATLLLNGKVLVAGDNGANTAELYDPSLSPNSTLIDDAQFFVHQHYLDFLSREPDADGLAYWTNQIAQCGSDARCIHERRIGVSAAFFVEQEFQQTGYVVYRLYRAAYGNMPNAPSRANVTFSQFMTDRTQLVGGAGLPQSTIDFANNFAARPQFKQAYPDSMSQPDFVNALFNMANLYSSPQQRQDEIDALMNGSKTRAQVLLDVIGIQEFKDREYNPAFVLMQYFGYLRRDVDQGGYDFWLNVLNNREPNNYRGMVCSFITSTEYQLRFGSSVTRSNADCGR